MASGETLCRFSAYNNEPPTSNAATLDVRGTHPVLEFDPSTPEDAVFSDIMPQHYADTTGVDVFLHYAMATATADTIDWDVSFERIGDGIQDMDTPGFAAVQSVDTTTVPGTSGDIGIIKVTFLKGSEMDSVVKGDGFRIKVTRDATNDDATGDAQLRWVEIRET